MSILFSDFCTGIPRVIPPTDEAAYKHELAARGGLRGFIRGEPQMAKGEVQDRGASQLTLREVEWVHANER